MIPFDKYASTIRIELSTQLAYKLNFLLTVIGPPLVLFFIKANLWWSIFLVRDDAPVGNYSFQRMLEYQAYVLVVTLLCQSYISRNISEDIRFGRISAFLLYPTSFIGYHFGAFSASQIINSLAALLVLAGIWGGGFATVPACSELLAAGLLIAIVSITWFAIWFLISSSSFWLEESWVLRVIFSLVARFLSGAVIPLDLFPAALREALWLTPFPYLTYVPTQLLMGLSPTPYPSALIAAFFWMVACLLLARTLWQRGLRLYSGAGI